MLAGGALAPSVIGVGGPISAPHSPGSFPPGLGGRVAIPPPPSTGITAKCVVKSSPVFDAYDPVNHYVYVSTLSGYVVVLNDSLANGACHVKTNIALPSGAAPRGLAFDPSDGQMYVVDGALNQVYIINGTKLKDTISNSSCASSFLGCHFNAPHGIAYDPDDGFMYVTNQGDGTVTSMAPSDEYVLDGTFSIGGHVPTEIAYSPFDDQMVVTDYGSNELSAFSGTMRSLLRSRSSL